MKAKAQYNDIEGTVAADMVDGTSGSMQEYLIKKYKNNYDSERYNCLGCEMFLGGGTIFVSYICFDVVEKKYVKFRPSKEISYDELFAMFKRFDVVIGKKMDDIEVENEPLLI